jgi:hypothetical protein
MESRANKVICKVRVFESINDFEKNILAEYIYLMQKRVTSRDKELVRMLDEVIAQGPNNVRILADAGRFAEARKWEDDVKYLESENGRIEYLRESMVKSIGDVHREIIGKRWEFVKAAPGRYFVTTDSPVVFDRNMGLSFATLMFPLSQDVILIANRSKGEDLSYRDASPGYTRKLNSMIIACAEQEIYSPRPDEWIYRGWTDGFIFPGTGSDSQPSEKYQRG